MHKNYNLNKILHNYNEATFNDVWQQVSAYIERQKDSQQRWQRSRCYRGSSTSWHWDSNQQGKRSHWVHTASWQPSSSASPSWQRRDSQQRWQRSRCYLGSSTSWHWDSNQQGKRSHSLHIVLFSGVFQWWHLPQQGRLRQQVLSLWKD